jgi:hypothetical protein
VRFLFTTLQGIESDFYGRVGAELELLGHRCAHVSVSRRSALELARRGAEAWCLRDVMDAQPTPDVDAEERRIAAGYGFASLRAVHGSDPACRGRDEAWCSERTVRTFAALEELFDRFAPDVVVPEVGSETLRTAAHAVGARRGAEVLFLYHTIFPAPLRLCAGDPRARIVADGAMRAIDAGERDELRAFVDEFTARAEPTMPHRRPRISARNLRDFGRHLAVKAAWDRDNEYLRPERFVSNYFRERGRALAARPLYAHPPAERPYVYFPLHVVDDFKIRRLIPHCADQVALAERVAAALPDGFELVLKEHPASVGRNPLALLRRIRAIPRVRLVEPGASSHDLMRDARAIAVISSTVGLEALLYGKPVLTLGQPFYSGYGVTVDIDSFDQIPVAVDRVLGFAPDREQTLRFLHAAMRACRPGRPVGVDASDANAVTLARSLDAALTGARAQATDLRTAAAR